MKSPLLVFFLLVLLAAVAGGTWYYELNVQIGGSDDSWLRLYQWSPYVGIACVALAYLVPAYFGPHPPLTNQVAALIEVFLTLLVAYFLGRIILFSLYTGFFGWIGPLGLWILLGFILLMTCYNLFLTSRRRLYQLGLGQIWVLLLGLVLPFVLSWPITERLFSVSSPVEIARTGVPMALLSLGLGASSYYLAESDQQPPSKRRDILDDFSFSAENTK